LPHDAPACVLTFKSVQAAGAVEICFYILNLSDILKGGFKLSYKDLCRNILDRFFMTYIIKYPISFKLLLNEKRNKLCYTTEVI
jgi:hypothetical protein